MEQLALFAVPATCTVTNCDLLVHVKRLELCRAHYIRHRRYGDPLGGGPRRPRAKAGRPVLDLADGQRQCKDCGQAKPITDYPVDQGGTRGRRASCKPCHSQGVSNWYADNREAHLRRQRARYHRDIDKMRARDLARYERDKDKRIALATDGVNRRRALKRGAEAERGITVIALRKRDGDRCCYCSQTMTFDRGNGRTYVPMKATIEHIVALARGGSHTWDNTALACWQCNIRKNAAPVDEWLAKSQVKATDPGGQPLAATG